MCPRSSLLVVVIAFVALVRRDGSSFEGHTGKYRLTSLGEERPPHKWVGDGGCILEVRGGTLSLHVNSFSLSYDRDITCPEIETDWLSEFKGRFEVAGIELRLTRVVAFHGGSDYARADMDAIILGDEITFL